MFGNLFGGDEEGEGGDDWEAVGDDICVSRAKKTLLGPRPKCERPRGEIGFSGLLNQSVVCAAARARSRVKKNVNAAFV